MIDNTAVDIEFVAMDKVVFPAAGRVTTASTKGLDKYAFAETQAEFAVVFVLSEKEAKENEAVSTRNILDWVAIALIDVQGGLIDFVVPIQPGVDVRGIALRERAPAQVPTLSQWGLITTVILLFVGALIFIKRRNATV